MWGDIGLVTDVRFLGVAPHWYFRPYMAWLIFCPHHYIGIFGLILFFLLVFFQVNILKNTWDISKNISKINLVESSFIYRTFYFFFLLSCLYAGSYLPCGRFFTLLYGNTATAVSFYYIFFFLLTNIEYYLYTFSNTIKILNKKKLLKVFLN